MDNSGTVTTANDGSDTASASLTVRCPDLTIAKTFTGNSLPPIGGFEQAAPGDTLTYTLAYSLTNGPVTDGVITDVLPAGQTYVDGSATDNADFTFESYDSTTRTLTWTAPTVTAGGSVTYQVTIDADGSDAVQPLTNTASIVSAETDPAAASAAVVVPAGAVEALTPPPTDVRTGRGRSASPGFSLMLILLGLAGFALVLGTITPVRERIRPPERDR